MVRESFGDLQKFNSQFDVLVCLMVFYTQEICTYCLLATDFVANAARHDVFDATRHSI